MKNIYRRIFVILMCVVLFLNNSTIEVFASEISDISVDSDDDAISEDDVNSEDSFEDSSDFGENSDEEYSQEVNEYENLDEDLDEIGSDEIETEGIDDEVILLEENEFQTDEEILLGISNAGKTLEGEGTEEKPYIITTAAEMDAVRSNLSAYYILNNDIDLSTYSSWEPIGDRDNPFTGVFNGNNHTVSNLIISGDDNYCFGLFGYAKDANIERIKIEQVSIKIQNEMQKEYSFCIGGVCGACENTTIQNISTYGAIQLYTNAESPVFTGGHKVGGICGYIYGGMIDNCKNYINITVEAVYIGGIAGDASNDVCNCINYGNISASSYSSYIYCGGITGEYGKLSNCVNYGDIYGETNEYTTYSSFATNCNVGGIFGANCTHNLTKLVNFGNVKGVAKKGGGVDAGGISGCAGHYKYAGSCKYVYNLGKSIEALRQVEKDGKYVTTEGNAHRIDCIGWDIGEAYSLESTLVNGKKITSADKSTDGESLTENEIYAKLKEVGIDVQKPEDIGAEDGSLNLYIAFSHTPEITYNNGYDTSATTLEVPLLCMLPIDSSSPVYEDVMVKYELCEGLSFSNAETINTLEIDYGTMSLSDVKRVDKSAEVYITAEDYCDEFVVVAHVYATVDGVRYQMDKEYTILVKKSSTEETEDSSIMDVVDKYTSQDAIRGLEDIWNANYSDEELKTHLYEYFCCDNLYDVKDNITKLQDSHDERWAYNGLICSDMYCASQWNSYLNSDEGILTRVALVASGLAFNGELGDWLSVSTYLDSEYPGVKKYKSLLEEYINDNKVEMEFYSYLKTGEKFVNGTAKCISSTQKAKFLKGFGKTKNVAEAHTVFNDFVYENLNGFLDDETLEIRVEKKTPLMEAFGTSHTIFKMTNVTVGGIEDFVEVESNIEAYKTCKSFLDEIIAADDLPLEMRMAASQLEEEYEKEYWAPVENILNQIRDECLDEALDLAGFSNVLDLNGYLTAIEYVSFVMNQFVDVGAMVKNSAYTEGYAKLAEHWCSKIETDKANYLQNRNEENAWAFYDDYMTLWKLRALGEKKYLKMNQLEGGKVVDGISDAVFGGNLAGVITEATGYADKEAAVNEILERLDSFKFQLDGSISVPEQYQYLQKVMVECPVDVEILSSNGSQVCVMKDGVESDTTNEYGRFKTVYRPTTGDFVKIAYLNNNDQYKIQVVGNREGKVSYTVATTNDNVNCEVTGFDDVVINKDSVIEIDTKSDEYLVDFNGDGNNIVTGKQADKNKLYAQFDFQNDSEIEVVYADENGYVTAPIPSEETGYKFLGWYTEPNGAGRRLFNYYDSSVITEPMVVYAYWTESNNEWRINSEGEEVTLLLTGDGYILNEEHQWDESKNEITRIEIGGNIKGAREGAFEAYSNLTSVYVGASVKNIDPRAIVRCDSLVRFEVSDDNKSYCDIDGILFSKDKETLIRFPEGKSGSYSVPSGTIVIGDYSFSKTVSGIESTVVGGINEVYLPNTVKTIGEGSFYGCQNLWNVTMTDSVEAIGEYCFCDAGITEIRLSNNIIEIPKYALSSSKLKTAVVSDKLQHIGSYAFKSGLKTLYSNGEEEEYNSVVLPSTVVKVESNAFAMSGIEHIVINSDNLQLGEGIFNKCTYLKDAYISGKIARINDYSFNSKSIDSITLPASVTSIGNKAFLCHDGLVINLFASYAPKLSESTFSGFSQGMNIVINVPVNARGYDADPWTNFSINKVLDLNDEYDSMWGDISLDDRADFINSSQVADGLWVSNINKHVYEYTGSQIKPSIRVYFGKCLLSVGKDYTLTYKNNTNVYTGEVNTSTTPQTAPTIVVKGKGNYSGAETVNFNIFPQDIGTDEFCADDISMKVTGKNLKIVPSLLWNGKSVSNRNYTLAYYVTDDSGDLIGEPIPIIKEAGKYIVRITGKGNYTGTRDIVLTVTNTQTLVSKLSIGKIANQSYTGEEIKPSLIVKNGATLLSEDEDYTVSYENNISVGTATAVIKGLNNYTGTRRITFKITGQSIKSAVVSGIPKTIVYTGNQITLDDDVTKLYIKATKENSQIDLEKDRDYSVIYTNNVNTGTATVSFEGINGYIGTVKKTFKIVPYSVDDSEAKLSVLLKTTEIPYVKGGVEPKPIVKYQLPSLKYVTLKEGTDYTLSYKNNKSVNDGTDPKKEPSITLKFRGNFLGTKTLKFTIEPKRLAECTLTATDKVYQKNNKYTTTVNIVDSNNQKLKLKTDYNDVLYGYKYDTVVINNGTEIERMAGHLVEKNDIIPANTVITVTASAKTGSNYIGNIVGEYRVVKCNISSAKVSIPKQIYTGKTITPSADTMTVKVGKDTLIAGTDFVVVKNSYTNNINKGTAYVTLKGIGNYGGTIKAKYDIQTKGFLWWWRNLMQ